MVLLEFTNCYDSGYVACKTKIFIHFFIPLSVWKGKEYFNAYSTQYTTMQGPHMDTLGHVHCSNTQRKHLKDSYGPGYTDSN